MQKTPATLIAAAAVLVAAADGAKGAPFIPAALRDNLSAAAEFASDAAELIEAQAAKLAQALADNAEQAAQIEALQSSQLAAHADVLARLDALEAAGKA